MRDFVVKVPNPFGWIWIGTHHYTLGKVKDDPAKTHILYKTDAPEAAVISIYSSLGALVRTFTVSEDKAARILLSTPGIGGN